MKLARSFRIARANSLWSVEQRSPGFVLMRTALTYDCAGSSALGRGARVGLLTPPAIMSGSLRVLGAPTRSLEPTSDSALAFRKSFGFTVALDGGGSACR
jgi:hypothetical protein